MVHESHSRHTRRRCATLTAKLIGAINMLVDSSERRGGEAARHLRPYTRPSRKEAERRENNLLMAILPICRHDPGK